MPLNRLVVMVGIAAPILSGQLYLLTGSVSNNHPETFATSLYRVKEDSVQRVGKDLVSRGVGIEWIGFSYDWRKAVIVARHDYTNTDMEYSDSIVVIDFDRVPTMKSCKIPHLTEALWMNSWLADTPAGPSYEWYDSGDDLRRDVFVKGMLLDAAIPCAESFATTAPVAVRNALLDGYPGIADVATSFRPLISVDRWDTPEKSGSVHAWIGGQPVPMGYQIPESLRRNFDIRVTNLTINDSHVFAVGIGDGKGRQGYRDLIFRKSDRTWHTFPLQTGAANLRGFGRYIGALAVHARTSPIAGSAGIETWKAGDGKTGPDLSIRTHLSGDDYLGDLYLYDVETDKVFPIVTHDGDSEILLVENNLVYYRVSDHLYSAPIESDHVGPPQLLATGDPIRGAHWAFFKH
jgi:hypothetical protein